ncbi:MAG: helix-turn-helix transcriptional regulator [Bacteroidales bacterium]|nr:helix-turn-helix transcriptional regulator [Bacteroidales bacterium]
MAILLRERRLRREKEGADAVINEAIGQLVPEHINASISKEEEEEQQPVGKRKIVIVEDEKSILSDRETDILPLIAQGLTSQLIADKLFLSLPTIKWYRRRLLMKFDAKNTAEMLSKAREAGLL